MTDLGHASHETIDTVAAAVVLIGGAFFTALAYRTRPARLGSAASVVRDRAAGGRPAPRSSAAGASLVAIMAGLSAGAAVIHLVAAPGHYVELGDVGAGFLVAAAFQGWWALRCLGGRGGPSPRLIAIGILGNLAIVGAWAWTRTIGLPVGPISGAPEPIGFPDGACAAFELLLVLLLVARRARRRGWFADRLDIGAITSIAIVPTLGLVLVLTSLATLAIATGLDHGAPTATSAAGTHPGTH